MVNLRAHNIGPNSTTIGAYCCPGNIGYCNAPKPICRLLNTCTNFIQIRRLDLVKERNP
jgi:hypothetical protein